MVLFCFRRMRATQSFGVMIYNIVIAKMLNKGESICKDR